MEPMLDPSPHYSGLAGEANDDVLFAEFVDHDSLFTGIEDDQIADGSSTAVAASVNAELDTFMSGVHDAVTSPNARAVETSTMGRSDSFHTMVSNSGSFHAAAGTSAPQATFIDALELPSQVFGNLVHAQLTGQVDFVLDDLLEAADDYTDYYDFPATELGIGQGFAATSGPYTATITSDYDFPATELGIGQGFAATSGPYTATITSDYGVQTDSLPVHDPATTTSVAVPTAAASASQLALYTSGAYHTKPVQAPMPSFVPRSSAPDQVTDEQDLQGTTLPPGGFASIVHPTPAYRNTQFNLQLDQTTQDDGLEYPDPTNIGQETTPYNPAAVYGLASLLQQAKEVQAYKSQEPERFPGTQNGLAHIQHQQLQQHPDPASSVLQSAPQHVNIQPAPVQHIKGASALGPSSSTKSSPSQKTSAPRAKTRPGTIEYPKEAASLDPTRPFVRSNNSKGLNRRGGKINRYDPKEYYEPVPTLPTWEVDGTTFEYRKGVLMHFYTAAEITKFILNHDAVHEAEHGKLQLWLQKAPGDSARRIEWVDEMKCVLAECLLDQAGKPRTIRPGHLRVALDEHYHKHGGGEDTTLDPFAVAGYMHLYCAERFLDLPAIAQQVAFCVDTRVVNNEPNGNFPCRVTGHHARAANRFFGMPEDAELARLTHFPPGYPRSGDFAVDSAAWPHEKTINYAMHNEEIQKWPPAKKKKMTDRPSQSQLIHTKGDLAKYVALKWGRDTPVDHSSITTEASPSQSGSTLGRPKRALPNHDDDYEDSEPEPAQKKRKIAPLKTETSTRSDLGQNDSNLAVDEGLRITRSQTKKAEKAGFKVFSINDDSKIRDNINVRTRVKSTCAASAPRRSDRIRKQSLPVSEQ